MMKKLLVALLLLCVFAFPVAACWLPPEPFETHAENADRVFTFEPVDWELGTTASVSLSDVDGDEIWRIDDFPALAFEGSFVFSQNMNEFAFFVPDTHVYALKLFADGELQFVYRVDDFIEIEEDGPVFSLGHHWLEEREFDSATNLLTLTTTQGDVHVLDLSRRAEEHSIEALFLPYYVEQATQEFNFNEMLLLMVMLALSGAAIAIAVIALRKNKVCSEEK